MYFLFFKIQTMAKILLPSYTSAMQYLEVNCLKLRAVKRIIGELLQILKKLPPLYNALHNGLCHSKYN